MLAYLFVKLARIGKIANVKISSSEIAFIIIIVANSSYALNKRYSIMNLKIIVMRDRPPRRIATSVGKSLLYFTNLGAGVIPIFIAKSLSDRLALAVIRTAMAVIPIVISSSTFIVIINDVDEKTRIII